MHMHCCFIPCGAVIGVLAYGAALIVLGSLESLRTVLSFDCCPECGKSLNKTGISAKDFFSSSTLG